MSSPRIFFSDQFRGDQNGKCATAIVICARVLVTVLLWLPIDVVYASSGRGGESGGLDLSLGASVRSYPLSGVAEGEAGYGILLWGSAQDPFSGYLRPRLAGATAVTYNSLDGAVEFFPLAFAGLRVGEEAIQNDRDYSAYDCVDFRCRGRFYRGYLEAELTLGYGPFFVRGRARHEHWRQPSAQTGDFIDPTSGLVMAESGQSQIVYYAMAGLKLDGAWTATTVTRYATSDQRAFSRAAFGLLRYEPQGAGFSISAGAGTFASAIKPQELSVIAYLRWEIHPSLALH